MLVEVRQMLEADEQAHLYDLESVTLFKLRKDWSDFQCTFLSSIIFLLFVIIINFWRVFFFIAVLDRNAYVIFIQQTLTSRGRK